MASKKKVSESSTKRAVPSDGDTDGMVGSPAKRSKRGPNTQRNTNAGLGSTSLDSERNVSVVSHDTKVIELPNFAVDTHESTANVSSASETIMDDSEAQDTQLAENCNEAALPVIEGCAFVEEVKETAVESAGGQSESVVSDSERKSLTLSSVARSSTATFASVFKQKEKKGNLATYAGPFLEDLDTINVLVLPDVCQVTDENLQDKVLAEDYSSLPPLRQGLFRSWSPSTAGPGHPVFSEYWSNTIPDMRLWNCVDAIRFGRLGRYVNPSRASPLDVSAKRMTGDGRTLCLHSGSTHAVCVTNVTVTDSYLLKVPPNGLPQKQLRGIVHSQEWERLVGFFCMAFYQEEISAQLYKDSLAFTTKSGESKMRDVEMFKHSSSSAKASKSMSSTTRPSESFLLDCHGKIPVYDGCTVDFDLKDVIEDLDTKLPAFEGEVPRGSFAVIGFTTSCYHSNKDKKWHLACNIQWAIVLGIPGN